MASNKDNKVLLVEDDADSVQLAREVLEAEGYSVLAAPDWTFMSDEIAAHQVGVILMDLDLPGVRGDALVPILRNRQGPTPSIVLYSGADEAELRKVAEDLGVARFFQKGQPIDRLPAIIAEAMEDYQARKREARSP